jgi:hypothetical protein
MTVETCAGRRYQDTHFEHSDSGSGASHRDTFTGHGDVTEGTAKSSIFRARTWQVNGCWLGAYEGACDGGERPK